MKRTITMTDRPPIRIDDEQWPLIASAQDDAFDGQHKSQSFRTTEWWMMVRRHEDGRALVYAGYDHNTQWQKERSYKSRRGVLLRHSAMSDIVDAIKEIALDIATSECNGCDDERWPTIALDCIADLPVEELA